MCTQTSPICGRRKAYMLQQQWPFCSGITSRVLRTEARTRAGWEEASLPPQVMGRNASSTHTAFWGCPDPCHPSSCSTAQMPSSTLNLVAGHAGAFSPSSTASPTRISHFRVSKIQQESKWAQCTEEWRNGMRSTGVKALCYVPSRGSTGAAESLSVPPQQQQSGSAPLHLPPALPVRVMLQNMAAQREERGWQEATAEFPADLGAL